jgi:hypothetical protein
MISGPTLNADFLEWCSCAGYFRPNGPTRWFYTPLRPMHDKRRVARELPSNKSESRLTLGIIS